MNRKVESAGRIISEVANGIRLSVWPLQTIREFQNVQDHLVAYGFAATINNTVKRWYENREFVVADYGIGYRIFANKTAIKANS